MEAKVALGPTRATDLSIDATGSAAGVTPVYAALDLGTNNCRLLIARPAPQGLQIVDAFSRIVRLGEDLSVTGRLSDAATRRTLAALSVCRDKMLARGVTRARLVATEACRAAANAPAFLREVHSRTGLNVEVVDRETEACLAAEGCAALADEQAESVVLFDIGGGSSEIVWLGREPARQPDTAPVPRQPHTALGAGPAGPTVRERIRAWTSLPLGVVSLADRFGGRDVSADSFAAMIDCVARELAPFARRAQAERRCGHFHLLGTSGTVTTVAGVHLGLPRYDRRRIDGMWMTDREVSDAILRLRAMPFSARVAHGCIGPDRADLVLAGCAILEAVRRVFPSRRLRVADRGLREGILLQMMTDDDAWGGQACRRRP